MKTKYFAFILVLGLTKISAAQEIGDIRSIWNDPIFQKQFIGSYGINAEIEPRVTPEEVKILEKIRPLMGENKLAEAEELLQKQIKPESSAILDFTLGSLQFQQEKTTLGLENYRKAVSKFPSFRRAWRNLGILYAKDRQYSESISAFTRMIELGGGDGFSYGLLGSAYAAKEDYQPAEAAYRNALLLQPETPEWRMGLTNAVLKQEKFQDAATLLNALIARSPEKAEYWILQGYAYLGMKQPLKAAENFEIVDQLGKGTVDTLHTLGDIYLTENLMDLAVRAYRRAIDVNLQQPITRPMHATEALAARGALTQAKQLATHIHEVWDKEMNTIDKRRLLKIEARLSMSEGGGNAETANVLEEVIKLDPLDGEALILLGQYYSQQNQPDRAILYYERAANISEFEPKAKLAQAQVLVSLNRFNDALPLLRRVQELKPREDIARYIEKLEGFAKSRK